MPRPGEQYVAWDTEVRGLGVRVSPEGTKTYVLKVRLKSRRVYFRAIGRIDTLTLDAARDKARELRGIAAAGGDPFQFIDAAKNGQTLAAVADRFLSEHVARKKPGTIRLYKLAINSHIRPTLGALPIADIGTDDVLRLHHRLEATPYLANRCLSVLSKLLSWSEQRKYRPLRSNPCIGLEKFPEAKRKRYLSHEELQRLGAAIRVAARRGAVSPSSLAIIQLLLLTGARVSEIAALKWSYIDLTRGLIHLPDSKTGAKTLVLGASAVDVLKAWPKFARAPYVFPGEGAGTNKGQHRVSLADAWAWLRTRAKIADVRLHDLRHSYASVAVSSGQSLAIVGGLLGHSQPATTARYAHLQDSPLRAASEATAGTIAAAIGRREKS